MTHEELGKIEDLVEEFKETLDNTEYNEWWGTPAEVGKGFLDDFVLWLGTTIGRDI